MIDSAGHRGVIPAIAGRSVSASMEHLWCRLRTDDRLPASAQASHPMRSGPRQREGALPVTLGVLVFEAFGVDQQQQADRSAWSACGIRRAMSSEAE
jgi:hypothetical protein